MSKSSCRPSTMPWLTPYVVVKDPARSLEFYQKAFGFAQRSAHTGPDGKIQHAEMTYEDAVIMLGPEATCPGQPPTKAPATTGTPSPVSLYLYCPDVDALHARAVEAGAKSEYAPSDMFWGDRMCSVSDPDGHKWSFATHKGGCAAA
jgi:uncharacterized glyoxalase superfamily protein PhnB